MYSECFYITHSKILWLDLKICVHICIYDLDYACMHNIENNNIQICFWNIIYQFCHCMFEKLPLSCGNYCFDFKLNWVKTMKPLDRTAYKYMILMYNRYGLNKGLILIGKSLNNATVWQKLICNLMFKNKFWRKNRQNLSCYHPFVTLDPVIGQPTDSRIR